MSRATSDDQLRFLLSCVRHSNNGRVDFVEVAQECGVVSKGAAAKRYERLLKANNINPGAPGAAVAAATSVAAPKSVKQKTRDPNEKPMAKKRKLETEDSPATEGDEKKLRVTSNVVPEAAIPIPQESAITHGVPPHVSAGGMPFGPGAPAMFIPRPPHMGHAFPPYPMQQRPGYPGFPPYGHRLEMPMYPPFAQTNFRDPWNAPMAAQDHGFEEYVNQDYVHQQHQFGQPPLALEPLPMRIPLPPQEVVPMEKAEDDRAEEEEETSKSGKSLVVVE